MKSYRYLQFKDENHLVLILEGVMEVDQLAMVKMVHDVNLFADERLLHRMSDGDELGGVDVLGLQLATTVDLRKGRCGFWRNFEMTHHGSCTVLLVFWKRIDVNLEIVFQSVTKIYIQFSVSFVKPPGFQILTDTKNLSSYYLVRSTTWPANC